MAHSEIISSSPISTRTFLPGQYYTTMLSGSDGTVAMSQNIEYAMRFEVGETRSFDRIGLQVSTAGALNTVRLGIRKDSNLYPGALLLDAGTIDASTTGYKEIVISQSLTPGRYWVTGTLQGGTGAVLLARSLDPFLPQNTTSASIGVFFQSGVTGALPGTFNAAVSLTDTGPKILMRAV